MIIWCCRPLSKPFVIFSLCYGALWADVFKDILGTQSWYLVNLVSMVFTVWHIKLIILYGEEFAMLDFFDRCSHLK